MVHPLSHFGCPLILSSWRLNPVEGAYNPQAAAVNLVKVHWLRAIGDNGLAFGNPAHHRADVSSFATADFGF
jgi:hypothetical protein